MAYKIVKRKIGKCVFCGEKFRAKPKSQWCKHVTACVPVEDDNGKESYIWRFERKEKPVSKRYRKKLEKHVRQASDLLTGPLAPKIVTLDEQYAEREKADRERAASEKAKEQFAVRGGSKAKHFFPKEGLDEYLKPKYKRQLTILRKTWLKKDFRDSLDPMEKKIYKGKIYVLAHKIKEARKQQKVAADWAKHGN